MPAKKIQVAASSSRVLDVKGAAAYLNMSQWFVRSLVYARKISFIKLGKVYQFDPADLDQYLTEHRVPAR